ncbi:acyl-CoA carboxylase epsilon subunit [Streptomyces apocyni]|uniref:acyl-CoA carboxylase epsilon subunit n=1 Tax=Streptomyces apocyni TaxID=2654677 RepID=UPI0012E994A2|nr:acyl-CoA carboxylase epsilon subunit [Streptomyces apocyni]
MSATRPPAGLRVTHGAPTAEELCAVLVALRLATTPAPAPKARRPRAPWSVPRAAADASPVSWAS